MNELVRRIAITIGALLIFRLGSHVPLPGTAMQSDLLSSSGINRISIFALTLTPYVSAAILVQLVSVVWGRLSALERSGEAGRRKIARITLIVTLLLASFQAFGVASAMQTISALVPEPGAWFLLSATASMVGGVFFMIWLSEQITRHGIGNGIALVLSVNILLSLPAEVATAIELLRQDQVSGNLVLFQKNSQYAHNANDTSTMLVLGGASIQANTGKGFGGFGNFSFSPPPPPALRATESPIESPSRTSRLLSGPGGANASSESLAM